MTTRSSRGAAHENAVVTVADPTAPTKAKAARMNTEDRKRKRRAVIARDGSEDCHWCGGGNAITLDHVIARSAGGSNAISNLVLSCEPCNQERGGVHPSGHPSKWRLSVPEAAKFVAVP